MKTKNHSKNKRKNQKRIRNYVLARKAFNPIYNSSIQTNNNQIRDERLGTFNPIIVRFGLEELKLLQKTITDISNITMESLLNKIS